MSDTCPQEAKLAVFSKDYAAVFVKDVDWTAGTGTEHVMLSERRTVGVKFWLASAEATADTAGDALAYADFVYRKNLTGITFHQVDGSPETVTPPMPPIGDGCTSNLHETYYDATAMNVYYADGLDQSIWCPIQKNVIYIASDQELVETLAHEFGHAFFTDDYGQNDYIMNVNAGCKWSKAIDTDNDGIPDTATGPGGHPDCRLRSKFTLGEVFRFNIARGSYLGNDPFLNCDRIYGGAGCPTPVLEFP